MPSNPGGACRPICSVTTAPQSPPCATYRVYPRRFISTAQDRATCGWAAGRHGAQSRRALAPVVLGRPIARELLHRRELHALRCIRDRFPVRPNCRLDAPAEIIERRLRSVEVEGANRVRCGLPRVEL